MEAAAIHKTKARSASDGMTSLHTLAVPHKVYAQHYKTKARQRKRRDSVNAKASRPLFPPVYRLCRDQSSSRAP